MLFKSLKINVLYDNKIKIDQIKILYGLLGLLILILTLAPFFKVGFTTGDDIKFYLTAQNGNVFEDARIQAEYAGRFYFLITKPLYLVPYMVDNFYFTKVVQYTSLLICFAVFALFLRKVFKENKEMVLLIVLLLFTFLMITPNDFVPIITYPFFFTTSFSIFIGSAIFLLKYYETNKNKHLITSVVLYIIALLFYENYLIFLLFLLAYIFIKNSEENKLKLFKKTSFYKELLPFVGVVALYIAVYFYYRKFFCESTIYSGSSFAETFSLKNFFKIIINFNLVFLPQNILNANESIFNNASTIETLHRSNFWYILKNTNLTTVINVILQCFVYILLFLKIKTNISWKKVFYCIFVCVLFALSSHVLVGVSEKYNGDSWWTTRYGYVTSFFSYFAIMSAVGLFFYSFLKLSDKTKILKYIFIPSFVCFIGYNLIIIGYMNDHFIRQCQQVNSKFEIIDKMAKRGVFDKIPENSIIMTPDFYNDAGVFFNVYNWNKYTRMRSDKSFIFCKDNENFIEAISNNKENNKYYLSLKFSKINNDWFVVLSNINDETMQIDTINNTVNNLLSNNAEVFYCSAFKNFNFSFYSISENTYQINDNPVQKANTGYNQVHVRAIVKPDGITMFNLSSSDFFDAENFSISNIGYFDSSPQTIY